MNLFKRSCGKCGCDIFLNEKDTYTYVIKNKWKNYIPFLYVDYIYYCIPCNREILIEKII
jgi:hypothetical protein